jgi:hypothetical protein
LEISRKYFAAFLESMKTQNVSKIIIESKDKDKNKNSYVLEIEANRFKLLEEENGKQNIFICDFDKETISLNEDLTVSSHVGNIMKKLDKIMRDVKRDKADILVEE